MSKQPHTAKKKGFTDLPRFEKLMNISIRCADLGTVILDETGFLMDLNYARNEQCAANYPADGNLDLDKLLASDDETFIQDILGITQHVIRRDAARGIVKDTGYMLNAYEPNCGFVDQKVRAA